MLTEKRKRLKIEIKNFGPVNEGRIILKPLTIFIGPNNSGKSYTAMLIHSIFEAYASTTFPEKISPLMREFRLELLKLFVRNLTYSSEKYRDDLFSKLKGQIDILRKGSELEVSKEIIKRISNEIFREIYEKKLNDEIVRSYACPLDELIKIGKEAFELKINFNSHRVHLTYQKADKLRIKEYPQLDTKIKVKITKSRRLTQIEEKDNEVLIKLGWLEREKREDRELIFLLINIIQDICISKIFENIIKPCYYLPAARSGILQGHKALAAGIVKKAPYVGIERLEIPKFSGVVSDFIASVITLPEEKGYFYKLAQEFEKELIEGEIQVETSDEYLYPEIKYKFQDIEIPLHRASSTVSELAPLFLYLKYTIQPNSILIIEEPEAHLHPENQRVLAKYLVKLIRKGVNVVITTHSEYLLEQLSSFVLLSKVKADKRVKKYNYGREDFITADEISAYVFTFDKKSKGYKILDVEVTEEDGISQEEFVKIHEALYEETVRLRRDIGAGM